MQRDLKTLLAYSTVENIGIIVIGLGLALAFKASGAAALAALALLAALFHAFNHALFKSLLFLGAGSILIATHERDIERLGGLNHRMTSTSLVFLVGSAAISALPPLNGFASEWLIFQAILNGATLPQWLLKFAVPVTGLILALAAALAGVAFVRAYGTAFLGRPRSAAAILARDVGATLRYPMIFLAALCIAAGVMPSGAVALLLPVARALLGPNASAFAGMSGLWLVPLDPSQSSYSGLITFLAITALVILLVTVIHRHASARVARGPAWDCGFPQGLAETQYTGSSFAQPIRRVFGPSLLAARESVDMPAPGETRPGRFEASHRDLVWDALYAPAARLVGWGTERVNFLQFLTIRRYLTLCFGALVLLLTVVAVSQ
jgi:NADH:ubiquinone oxidoreductase subunit 5 (subunit L)/multisubunit Na+/H+ antiporter MnhA subunit